MFLGAPIIRSIVYVGVPLLREIQHLSWHPLVLFRAQGLASLTSSALVTESLRNRPKRALSHLRLEVWAPNMGLRPFGMDSRDP